MGGINDVFFYIFGALIAINLVVMLLSGEPTNSPVQFTLPENSFIAFELTTILIITMIPNFAKKFNRSFTMLSKLKTEEAYKLKRGNFNPFFSRAQNSVILLAMFYLLVIVLTILIFLTGGKIPASYPAITPLYNGVGIIALAAIKIMVDSDDKLQR